MENDEQKPTIITKLVDDLKPHEKDQAEPKKVFSHEMRYDRHGSLGNGIYCTCGQHKIHNRGKVLMQWVFKHNKRTGHRWVPPREGSKS